jgi:hypothetical protein
MVKSRISHITATVPKATMHARDNMHRARHIVNAGPHGDAISQDGLQPRTLSCYCPVELPQFRCPLSVCSTSKELNVFAGSELWKCMLLVDTFERLQCPPIPAQI